jgi:hypothetical protein
MDFVRAYATMGVRPIKGDELARREVVEVTCDICGAGTDRKAAKSSRALTVDGKQYTIDLCATHTNELDTVVAPFVAAARRAGGSGRAAPGRRPRSRPVARSARHDMSEVRQWARANGFANVAGRGRVPREALAAWEAAHGGAPVGGGATRRPRKTGSRPQKQVAAG